MRRAAVVLVIYLLPLADVALADVSGDPVLKQQYDSAFDAMYRDPGDLGKTVEYARVAARIGDLEGAIGALERLLMFNPELTDIQLELGKLYFQLGSNEIARVWLTKALAGELSDENRAEAERDLASIAKLQSRSRVSGSLVAGLSYQTNANAGSSHVTQIAGVVTPAGIGAKADANGYLLGNLIHTYDFERQDATVLETDAVVYGSRQFSQQTLNAGFLEIDSGPRFLIDGPDRPGTSIHPYFIANGFSLGDAFYFGGAGLGVTAATAPTRNLTLLSLLEFRQEWFSNSSSQPTATDRTGQQVHGRVGLGYALTASDVLSVQLDATGVNAHASFETFQEYGLSGGWSHTMAQPWSRDGNPLETTLTVGHLRRPYSQPNPSIAPGTREVDDEWDLGASIRLALGDGFFVQLLATQNWVSSTVAEFRYSDTTTTASIGWNF
jgi:hypothetical protein